jgi:hypothetical protein
MQIIGLTEVTKTVCSELKLIPEAVVLLDNRGCKIEVNIGTRMTGTGHVEKYLIELRVGYDDRQSGYKDTEMVHIDRNSWEKTVEQIRISLRKLLIETARPICKLRIQEYNPQELCNYCTYKIEYPLCRKNEQTFHSIAYENNPI